MANLNDAKAKVAYITLRDGVKRELRFTLNAMAEMEDRYGSVDAAFTALENNSIKAVRFILWAGLLHDEEQPLTEQQVGNLIDTMNMADVINSINEAMTNDMPPKEDGGAEALPNA